MLAMDTLLSMKVFRQVVESGSFVGAAERLNLSTAMTSKHLMHLEKHLGTRLLNRSSRSLSLTESGKLFFERCKWTATRQLVEFVATYRQRYPEVVLDLSFEDRVVDIIEEGYDLAIRATLDQPPAGLIARPLRPMPFVIAASKDYVKRCGVPKSPGDLAQHDCIMIGSGQSWLLTGPNGDIEAPARVVLRFGSMTVAVAHAVCTGIGLAPLPRILFEDSMFRDSLCPVLTQHPLRHPDIYAIYVSRKHLPLKIRTFVDHVFEYDRIPLPWDDAETA